MKKNALVTLIGLLTAVISYAQDFPSYGRVTNDELNLKECPFDKEANAVVLLDEAESNYNDSYNLITNRHIRIKILKEKGFDEANVSIYFNSKDDFEGIYKLEAMITNKEASGNITVEKLSSKAFYKKKENDNFSKMIFTFPNVKVGSIIEYQYQSFMKHYGGLRDWYFHDYLPVVQSKYTLVVAPHLEFAYKVNKSEEMPIIFKQDKESGKIYFEMNNIPGLDDEPYMDAREDYLQKVVFQISGFNSGDGFGKKNYMTTWDESIKELLADQDFGVQLNKNIPGTGEIMDVIKKMNADEEKMNAVYNYVRNNMHWNGIYSKYAREGIKDPWSKKQGNSGEVNIILNNLLKEVGLNAYPVLVSERFHGKVDAAYPFLDQFNSVFACVVIKEKKYYLDATDTYTTANVIPNDILNTTALIVNKKNGGLVNITNEELEYNDYVNAQMEVKENGAFSGNVFIKNEGYSKIKKAGEYASMEKEKFIDRYYKNEGMVIDSFQFSNKNIDSFPVEQKFNFSTTLPSGGGYMYLPLNLFFGFEKNPFTSDTRFSNVNFGYKRKYNTYTLIKLPEGYILDGLPKGVRMTTPDKDIVFTRTAEYNKESNSLVCMFNIEFKKSLYTVDEYPVLQEVYKKMFDFLKEPVVLKLK